MLNKCIFTTRFKECCKENGYTQQDIADKLNISLDGLKHHLRASNPHFPPLDLMIKIADILNVDIGYLIGEIDCKRYSTQSLSDITILKDEVFPYILKNSNKMSFEVAFLFYVLSCSPYIHELSQILRTLDISCILEESVSISYNEIYSHVSTADIKDLLIAKAASLFSNILSDRYSNISTSGHNEKVARALCQKLLIMIDEEKKQGNVDYKKLYKRVEYNRNEIKKFNTFEYLTFLTPKQIVNDKYQRLKELYLDENDSRNYYFAHPFPQSV